MASEILSVPEEHLLEVIAVIRAGLANKACIPEVRERLAEWCDEEEAYITQ